MKFKPAHKRFIGTLGLLTLCSNSFAQWNPRPNWEDSYAVDGVCYCNSSNYDHNLDEKSADTPIGELNVVRICEDIQSTLGTGRSSGRIPYNDIQCGNGPANDAADEEGCPGRVDIGSAGCDDIGPKWDLESVYGPWPGNNTPTPTPVSTPAPTPSPVTNPVAPSVSFVEPINAETFDPSSDRVIVNASDDGSIDNVKLYLDGVFIRQENNAPYEWSNTNTNDQALKNLSFGSYNLTAIAEDNTGLTSEASVSITVGEDEPVDVSTGCNLPWSDSDFSVSSTTRNYSSGAIDISCVNGATLSLSIEGTGPMEDADYLNVYYSIDGGSRVAASLNQNAFTQKNVIVPNLSGSNLELIIETRNSFSNETYTVSNISIDNTDDGNSEGGPEDNNSAVTYLFLPHFIEAENYESQSGVLLEDSQDNNSQSVGWIDTGDYLTYGLRVTETGAHPIDFRVASRSAGVEFDIYQGDTKVGSVSYPATGGWYDWEIVETSVNLDEGNQIIKIVATQGGWNINWLSVGVPE